MFFFFYLLYLSPKRNQIVGHLFMVPWEWFNEHISSVKLHRYSKRLRKKVLYRSEEAAVESCGYLSNRAGEDEGSKQIKKYSNKNKPNANKNYVW